MFLLEVCSFYIQVIKNVKYHSKMFIFAPDWSVFVFSFILVKGLSKIPLFWLTWDRSEVCVLSLVMYLYVNSSTVSYYVPIKHWLSPESQAPVGSTHFDTLGALFNL